MWNLRVNLNPNTGQRAFLLTVLGAALVCPAWGANADTTNPAATPPLLLGSGTPIPQPARYAMFALGGAVLMMMRRGWHRS